MGSGNSSETELRGWERGIWTKIMSQPSLVLSSGLKCVYCGSQYILGMPNWLQGFVPKAIPILVKETHLTVNQGRLLPLPQLFTEKISITWNIERIDPLLNSVSASILLYLFHLLIFLSPTGNCCLNQLFYWGVGVIRQWFSDFIIPTTSIIII